MLDFVDDILEVDAASADAEAQVEEAFVEHFGSDRASVEGQWLSWLQDEFGGLQDELGTR